MITIAMNDFNKYFSKACSGSRVLSVLTDSDYIVIDSNSEEFIAAYSGKCLYSYMRFPLNYNKSEAAIVQAKIKDINYSADILPLFSEDELDGFIIRFLAVTDIFRYHNNLDYCNLVFEEHADIRAQISSVISSAMLIHSTLERNELYDEIKSLDHMVNNCYKILSVIQNKTELAKYALAVFNINRLDIGCFTKDISALLSALTRSLNVTIETHFDKDVYVETDVDRYVVMLLNIIINAIEYNLEEIKVIKINIKKYENDAVLTVSDNGLGMRQEIISDILNSEPVYNSIKKPNTAPGCGYYVIKCFCLAFGGSLIINSKENEGTTVSVKLPLSKKRGTPEYIESRVTDYLSNRFSNIYVAMSKILKIKFY